MPETTKTYANMEILQGADYEITLTLDTPVTGKSYIMVVRKDFSGSTDFGGSNSAALAALVDGSNNNLGYPLLPYRAEFFETNAIVGAGIFASGKLTVTQTNDDSSPPAFVSALIKINLYAAWTETLDDDFDGYWEIVEKDSTSFSRIAQGEFYVNNTASRYASINARSD